MGTNLWKKQHEKETLTGSSGGDRFSVEWNPQIRPNFLLSIRSQCILFRRTLCQCNTMVHYLDIISLITYTCVQVKSLFYPILLGRYQNRCLIIMVRLCSCSGGDDTLSLCPILKSHGTNFALSFSSSKQYGIDVFK